MPAPLCVAHDCPMILKSTEVALHGKRVVDVYGCEVSGCPIKFVEKLGGYGTFGETGNFVLIVRPQDYKPS